MFSCRAAAKIKSDMKECDLFCAQGKLYRRVQHEECDWSVEERNGERMLRLTLVKAVPTKDLVSDDPGKQQKALEAKTIFYDHVLVPIIHLVLAGQSLFPSEVVSKPLPPAKAAFRHNQPWSYVVAIHTLEPWTILPLLLLLL